MHLSYICTGCPSGGALTAIFRWEAPARAHGVVSGYEVQCWALPAAAAGAASSACADVRLPPTHTQLILRDLVAGSTYYFQVTRT